MKLELKHLAHYLPYKLKFMMQSDPNSKEPNIDELKSLDTGLNMVNFGWGNAKEFTEIKPILRPLSDLTRKIDFRGKKVFPVEIIQEYCGYEILTNKERMVEPPTMLPYVVFNLLCDMHFDMFNLIPQGLAISIHEIKEFQ